MAREPYKQTFDLVSCLRATDALNAIVESAKKLVEDADQSKRLEELRCRACHYQRSRAGGTVTTRAICGGCDAIVRSGNTVVDLLCRDCAKHHAACRHCGASLNERMRRKLSTPTEDAGS